MLKILLPLQQLKFWAKTQANPCREIQLELTSLSCNRLVISTGKNSGGYRGSARNVNGRSQLKRGSVEQKKEKTYLQHLAPQSWACVENGWATRIGSRSSFLCGCECEPSRRRERWCRGASPCLTHVFPIDSWRQPSSSELAWQSRIEAQTEYGFKAVRKRTGMLFRKFFRHGQGLGCSSTVGKSDWGSFWTRAGPAHTRQASRPPPSESLRTLPDWGRFSPAVLGSRKER